MSSSESEGIDGDFVDISVSPGFSFIYFNFPLNLFFFFMILFEKCQLGEDFFDIHQPFDTLMKYVVWMN